MAGLDHADFQTFMEDIVRNNPGQPEFIQAVREVAQDIFEYTADKPEYHKARIMKRLAEPDRSVSFRVCWQDDQGEIRVQRGWRVQNNNAIGPYKGGLRFHADVNKSVLKFLAFEQTFKNALTGLPMGGAKGGANFDPKGKSENEIMRFCQSFMTELFRHIGPDTDVPAGDIGVGAREIGYMFGQYKRITGQFVGAMTGKGIEYGGSMMRPEATGYGTVYFVQEMLHRQHGGPDGQTVLISGSGNVAQFAASKCNELNARVVCLSDSGGVVYFPQGMPREQLSELMHFKNHERGRLADFAQQHGLRFEADKTPWHIPADIALPCATQNEIDEHDANLLIANGVHCVAEGANMPCTLPAVDRFIAAKVLFAPGKASNAGGVATSGLEMSQNAMRISWHHAEVDERLRAIMKEIHLSCIQYGKQPDGSVNYLNGANIASFVKVADAMLAQGIV